MIENTLKKDLLDGKSVLGTWSVIPSSSTADIIGISGFDFIIIDMEHGPISFETAEDMVRACEVSRCTPLLRVPQNDESFILRGLEIGSHGIVVPNISSKLEAESAIKAIKYHPEGHRGFSPFTRSGGYTAKGADTLASRLNEQTLSVLLVEGTDGINDLDNILELPGIDVIYIGTYDLSQSIGFPGQTQHPEVLSLLEQCTKQIREKGKAVGCLAQSLIDLERWLDIGIQFIPYLADCALLNSACVDILNTFKEASQHEE